MDLATLVAPPSPDDILAQVARIELDGQEYVLPVLPVNARRRWEAALEAALRARLSVMEDIDRVEELIALFDGYDEQLIESLAAYDRDNVLGGVEAIGERARQMDLVLALMRVWRAGHPLADIGAMVLRLVATTGTVSEPTSSPPTNGAGGPPTSATGSPTSSSSRSSTRRASGSRGSRKGGSPKSAPGPSSPTTNGPSSAGGGTSRAQRRRASMPPASSATSGSLG